MSHWLGGTLLAAVFVTAGYAQQPGQPSAARPQADATAGNSETIIVTGCLIAGQGGQFRLAVPPPKAADTARAPTTTTYRLRASDQQFDFREHVNEMVEVTGIELPSPTGTAGTTGAAAGGTTPTVKTTTQAAIEAKELSVSAVRTVATKCDLVK
jgi:hypothetical protein